MTNREYILKTLGLFGISEDTVDVILLDGGLNGSASCDAASCKIAMHKSFHLIRAAAHRNVSEGGFSMSWNDCEKALKDFEGKLAEDAGDNGSLNGAGCIDRSDRW